MPFDALFLTAVRRELAGSLTGCRVDKVQQPQRDTLILSMRGAAGGGRLNGQSKESGNTVPLSSLKGTLSSISTGRYLVSRERTGSASLTTIFARKQDSDRWRTSLNVFGFSPVAENILTVKVEMDEEDSAINEEQTVDLPPNVLGFEGHER